MNPPLFLVVVRSMGDQEHPAQVRLVGIRFGWSRDKADFHPINVA
jgi:hypothetical protein